MGLKGPGLRSSVVQLQEKYLIATFRITADIPDSAEELPPLIEDSDSEIFHETDDESNDADIFYASDEDTEVANPIRKKRRTDHPVFLGKTVCRAALERLLGVGATSINKLSKGEPAFTNSSRPPRPKHPTFQFVLDAGKKWMKIVMFLFILYHSAAETLSKQMTTPHNGEAQMMNDPDYSMRVVNAYMNSLNTQNDAVDLMAIGPGTFAGGKRHLHHGSRTDLFYDYKAYCALHNEEPSSYDLFLRVVNKVLKPGVRGSHLAFRKASEHAQCNECWKLKNLIRKSRGDSKLEHIRTYTTHLLGQWMDRQIYWSFRAMSREWFTRSIELGRRFLG